MLKIFNRADCFADISFDVNGEEKIVAHRAILAARSAYMREQIVAGRWRKTEIRFRNAALRPVAWKGTFRLVPSALASHVPQRCCALSTADTRRCLETSCRRRSWCGL